MNIHLSAYKGDIASIKQCLEQNPEHVNSILRFKHENRVLRVTPIFLAVIASKVKAVEFLLQQGAKTNLGNKGVNIFRWNFLTHPIHEKYRIFGLLAAHIGSEELLPLFSEIIRDSLEDFKASALALSRTLEARFGPIVLADDTDFYVMAGVIGTPFYIEILMLQSKDPERVNSIALGAAAANRTDTLQLLHDKFFFHDKSSVNFNRPVANQSWHTPLTIASLFNCANVVSLLCEPKFRLDPSTPIMEGPLSGATPLILAARHGHVKCAEILCNQPNVKDDQSMTSGVDKGRNAIYSSAINGDLPIFQLLCKKAGSDPGRPLWIGPERIPVTPIQIAAYKGFLNILRDVALDPDDIKDDFPRKWKLLSALHVALLLKRIDFVEAALGQSQSLKIKATVAVDARGTTWPLINFLFLNLGAQSDEKSQAVAAILQLLAIHGIALEALSPYMLTPNFRKFLPLVPLETKIEKFYLELPYLLNLITGRRMIPEGELLLHCDNGDYSVYGTKEQTQFTRDTVGAMLEKLMASSHQIKPALLAKLESLLASHNFKIKYETLNDSEFRHYPKVLNLVMDITTHLKHLESKAQGISLHAPSVEWVLMD